MRSVPSSERKFMPQTKTSAKKKNLTRIEDGVSKFFIDVAVAPSGHVESLPLKLALYQLPQSFFGRAFLAHSCTLCPLPHVFGKGPSPVHEGDTQALNHSGNCYHPSDFDGSPRSSRHVSLHDKQLHNRSCETRPSPAIKSR